MATKIDKTKFLKTNGSLMKVESSAECSLGAFCITFDLHKAIIGSENQFRVYCIQTYIHDDMSWSVNFECIIICSYSFAFCGFVLLTNC